MRTTARRRILDYVAQRPGATTGQIALGLGMTSAAVRHHLAILIADGRFERAAGSKQKQRGRPAQHFRLSERFQGDNLAMIADAALSVLGSAMGRRTRGRLMEALAAALIEQVGPIDARVPASKRLTALVARLSVLHYAAHWEAGASGPRLLLGRCPYASVIRNHPELCQMDARAIAYLAETGAEQIAKMDVSSRTPGHCVFLLE